MLGRGPQPKPWDKGLRPRGWRTGRVGGNLALLGGCPWGLVPGAARSPAAP
jgi:hypothetical protein